MSLLTDVAIPAALGIVVMVVIFFLKGVLAFIIGVPLWIIAEFVVVMALLFFIPMNILVGFYRYGREGFVAMRCRRENLPLILDIEVSTNEGLLVAGEKEDENSPLLKENTCGVKVDPSFVTAHAEPVRLSGGLNMYGYAHHDWRPQTTRNHLAFKAIIEYFHNEPAMNELNFLSENEFIEVISKSELYLDSDLKTLIGKYYKKRVENKGTPEEKVVYWKRFQKTDDVATITIADETSSTGKRTIANPDYGKLKTYEDVVEIPHIIDLIHRAKADVTKLPIATGYFSMNEAFKYNNVSYIAKDVSQLKNLLSQLIYDKLSSMFNFVPYGTVIVACLCVLVIGIYVLASTVFK